MRREYEWEGTKKEATVANYEDVSKGFRTESITEYTLTFGITR